MTDVDMMVELTNCTEITDNENMINSMCRGMLSSYKS